MTGTPGENVIAIDTNVLVQLLDKSDNEDSHINDLLGALIQEGYRLLIDQNRQILGEYQDRIEPLLKSVYVKSNEKSLLKYWFRPEIHTVVNVDALDQLMNAISSVVTGQRARVDRVFVYVALHEGGALISNDGHDIVEGPSEEMEVLGERRVRVLEVTRDYRPDGSTILRSREAAERFAP